MQAAGPRTWRGAHVNFKHQMYISNNYGRFPLFFFFFYWWQNVVCTSNYYYRCGAFNAYTLGLPNNNNGEKTTKKEIMIISKNTYRYRCIDFTCIAGMCENAMYSFEWFHFNSFPVLLIKKRKEMHRLFNAQQLEI